MTEADKVAKAIAAHEARWHTPCSRCGNVAAFHREPNSYGVDNCGCPPIPEHLLRERPEPPKPAPCPTCGGARFVCDCVMTHEEAQHALRAAKTFVVNALAALPPSPPKPGHSDAPVCPFDTTWLYWCMNYSGTCHIDTHSGEHNGTRMHPVQVIRYALFEAQKAYTDEAKAELVAEKARTDVAEAKVEELEAAIDDLGQHIADLNRGITLSRAEGYKAGIEAAIGAVERDYLDKRITQPEVDRIRELAEKGEGKCPMTPPDDLLKRAKADLNAVTPGPEGLIAWALIAALESDRGLLRHIVEAWAKVRTHGGAAFFSTDYAQQVDALIDEACARVGGGK